MELPPKDGTGQSAKATGTYVLRNKYLVGEKKDEIILNNVNRDYMHLDMGFLMMILAAIYINNNVVDSEQLFIQLGRIGFIAGESHPVYGEWEKVISKFVRQCYLQKTKSTKVGREGKTLYEYRMGQRAKLEIGNRAVLNFVAQIYGEEVDPIKAKELEIEEQRGRDNEDEQLNSGDGDDNNASEEQLNHRRTRSKTQR